MFSRDFTLHATFNFGEEEDLQINERASDKSSNNKSISQRDKGSPFGPENFVQTKSSSFALDYLLIKCVGEGSYGKVFRVVHRKTDLVRAMKSSQINNIQ